MKHLLLSRVPKFRRLRPIPFYLTDKSTELRAGRYNWRRTLYVVATKFPQDQTVTAKVQTPAVEAAPPRMQRCELSVQGADSPGARLLAWVVPADMSCAHGQGRPGRGGGRLRRREPRARAPEAEDTRLQWESSALLVWGFG